MASLGLDRLQSSYINLSQALSRKRGFLIQSVYGEL